METRIKVRTQSRRIELFFVSINLENQTGFGRVQRQPRCSVTWDGVVADTAGDNATLSDDNLRS